jgi:L-fucose isomerase-like protein
VERKRNAFCGKLSERNNLRQYGTLFSMTQNRVLHPEDDSFKTELEQFIGICPVVKGFRNIRIGASPTAFNTLSALVDWNNNCGGALNKCVFFHCGNCAKSLVPEVKISAAPILGTIVGEKNTCGALQGRTPAGFI